MLLAKHHLDIGLFTHDIAATARSGATPWACASIMN